MSTTAPSSTTWSPDARTKVPASSTVPPPSRLTAAQEVELEAELLRELGAVERRLASERQSQPAERQGIAARDAVATRGVSDTELRRDAIAAALARLDAGAYGTCSHCGEPIPFGRLLVMPEATHCLSCSGRA